MSNDKRTMTYIGKIDLIENAYKKMLLGEQISFEENSLLLATAICLLDEYDADQTKKLFFEISYEIIARYSVSTSDYRPLYDFSVNYGFFPIVDYILEHDEDFLQSVADVINKVNIDKYRTESFLPTIQQHNAYESVLNDENSDISFVAPTSFGKSELIIRHIKKVNTPTLKAAIIVPTKSLLMQTYKYVKAQLGDKKILLHDQMYTGEESYIAVLTQERALRLLEKRSTHFDYLYIDEAHNLFEKDMRNRLLARLIRLSRLKNQACEILYFSPLVETSDNLKVLGTSTISEYRIVKVTLASICSSDLHIKHGSVPRAVEGITVGHEMVGIVEEVGSAVTHVKPGDRVAVNVETFCGECFFCKKGFVNNCIDKNGGWALGCRIDGGQAEYVRVPFADQGLNKIPDTVTDRQALLVGDVLATGYWATKISEITEDDIVLIIGAGPTGICTLLCVMLKNPKRIIVCEKDENRIKFVNEHYPDVLTVTPEECLDFVRKNSDHGGADVVLEVAGSENTFELAWQCARPNAIVTVVALYDKAQTLPLPDMYGKNLTFKTGGVDGCDCEETLKLIADGKLDTEPLITHTYPLAKIDEAYELFENKRDGVIKVAVEC